jgi:hypothetical protein
MIGYYGDIIFETSDKKILNFMDFKLEHSGRWTTHEPIGIKPKTEFNGPGLLTASFTVELNGRYGVKPKDELKRWRDYSLNGNAELLVIGGKPLGEDLWIVKSVSEAWGTILNGGELFSAKVDVSLEEYISEV